MDLTRKMQSCAWVWVYKFDLGQVMTQNICSYLSNREILKFKKFQGYNLNT